MEQEFVLYPNLRAEMGRRGLNMRTLGLVLGVTKATISRKLTGKGKWSLKDVDRLCKYFDCTYEYLFKKND